MGSAYYDPLAAAALGGGEGAGEDAGAAGQSAALCDFWDRVESQDTCLVGGSLLQASVLRALNMAIPPVASELVGRFGSFSESMMRPRSVDWAGPAKSAHHARGAGGVQDITAVGALYEDRFLRAARAGERGCIHGTHCVGASARVRDSHLARVESLVEFRLPDAVERDRRDPAGAEGRPAGMCVLCTRMVVGALFIESALGNASSSCLTRDGETTAWNMELINEYCNLVDEADGYRVDACIPPPGCSAAVASRMVGSVCALNLGALAWVQDPRGEWWLNQQSLKQTLAAPASASAALGLPF